MKLFFYSPDPDDSGSDTSVETDTSTDTTDSSSSSDDTTSDTDNTDSSSTSSDDTSSSNNDDSSSSTSSDTTSDSSGAATGDGQSSGSVDYDTDMQTIRDYVSAVVEAKTKIATAYLSAIDNFQTTVQTASPDEARPDLLGTVLKSGLKLAEKQAVTAVKDETGADLGPLVDLVHAIYDEVDRAQKAAESLAVAEWIKNVRTSVTNAYTQDQTGETLRNQLESEYKNNSEGGRGGYIGGIQNELAAVGKIQPPKEEIIEVGFYTAWINEHFNNDCIDGTGIIYLLYDDDGNTVSATVTAPQGDRIAGALNNIMAAAGIYSLMNLDVDKKVCKSDSCMCFEGNNVVRKAAPDDAAQTFLTSQDNWNKFRNFKKS